MRRCDVCDCAELCKRIVEAGAVGITCREMTEMVVKIIEKNVDEEE